MAASAERQICCACENRGKCKSCECRRRGCNNCANPSCQFKITASTSRSRIHPYAANSSRNQPQGDQGTSRNQDLQVAAMPANRADEEERVSLTAVVDRMSEGELRRCLRAAAIAEPEVMRNFIIGQHRVEPVIGDPGSSNSNVPGCSCGKCIVFTDPRMNICCGQRPCITSKTEFKNLCLRHDVLEVANILNWSYQFNQEPSFRNSTFRNQAYRNFILWQHGRLGARRRVPVPSCVCKTVRDRFPESNGLYRGYHSANSDSE